LYKYAACFNIFGALFIFMTNLKDKIQDQFPFITVITYGNLEYVGIVINQDNNITSIYDYNILKADEHKKYFLEMGDVWWWESNRMLPINIFLRKEMELFRYAIKNFATKDVAILIGPVVNLHNIMLKRVKRRSVQLVRKR
jgi:hypothetical protein